MPSLRRSDPLRVFGIVLLLVLVATAALGAWAGWLALPALSGLSAQGRVYHTATTLADGRVLVAGGQGDSGALSAAAIYDPERNVWKRVASMHDARFAHVATLLGDGRVIVIGGEGNRGLFSSRGGDLLPPYLASAEIYDPQADRWKTTTPMPQTLGPFRASLGGSGVVNVEGVSGGSGGHKIALQYVIAGDSWRTAVGTRQPRATSP